jgi:transcription elongation GreA/GreB family factor
MLQAPFTKTDLVSFAQKLIAEKIDRVKNILAEISDSIVNESKSSAGDKHETSRAMLHLEEEKNRKMLSVLLKERSTLQAINTNQVHNTITIGSLLSASDKYFFIGIGLGAREINGAQVILISSHSPITKQLIGKKIGEVFTLANETLLIENVC